ncbi:Uncharacterised protein [Mycobacteroides abscessus subsp. abscessus]|nr:Uncharacterised protein [Mycobacteroides abscessus subsp. abscessus]
MRVTVLSAVAALENVVTARDEGWQSRAACDTGVDHRDRLTSAARQLPDQRQIEPALLRGDLVEVALGVDAGESAQFLLFGGLDRGGRTRAGKHARVDRKRCEGMCRRQYVHRARSQL